MPLFLFAALSACTVDDDSAETEVPSIEFLAPTPDEVLPVGDVAFSVIVEHFLLVDVAKDNAGEPEGYIGVRVDGTEVLQTGATTFDLTLADAGTFEVEAELFFTDGDTLDEAFGEPVSAAISVTVGTL
jgi:hypothetical protein